MWIYYIINVVNLLQVLVTFGGQFWYVTFIPKYLNFATFSNDLLVIFMFWFCPAFCSLGINVRLVLSAFTSRPNSLPATDNLCSSNSMFIFHNLEFCLWSKNFAICAFNVTVVCKSCYPFKLTSDPNLWHWWIAVLNWHFQCGLWTCTIVQLKLSLCIPTTLLRCTWELKSLVSSENASPILTG